MHENCLSATQGRALIKMILLLVCSRVVVSTAAGQQTPVKIDLEQAIQIAIDHNHALKAARTQIQQSQAQEITASLRPNPVFSADYSFVPVFSPSFFGIPVSENPLPPEFDAGVSYTIERGHKRQARTQAARDQTAVTRSQVTDNERTLVFNVAQQFVAALLAKSTLEFALKDLASFELTVGISDARYKAGDISENDFLRIKLQLLQFQTDVSAAQLSLVQALASLRSFLGYESVPDGYDVAGDLAYAPLHVNLQDLQAVALGLRPDFLAAQQSVTAAQSQYQLARANGKRDLTLSFTYNHTTGLNTASFGGDIEIAIFDKNQGEIARTRYAITQFEESRTVAEQTVMTDVRTAYEAARTDGHVVELYESGYLKVAQESREISEFAYQKGAASLLDFLDAERSYRATQLAYRQALGTYMVDVEQLRQAVGTRKLP
jgi:outer membrane protein, heavy metal efflux system